MPHRAAYNWWHRCGIAVKQNVWHAGGMAREDLHFRLRIPPDLKEKVEAAANSAKRSMTAEIIARLEASFQHRADAPMQIGATFMALIEALSDDDVRHLEFASRRLRQRRQKAMRLANKEPVDESKPK